MWLRTAGVVLIAIAARSAASDTVSALPFDPQCQLTSSVQQVDFGQQSYARYQVVDEQQRKLSPGARTLQINALCGHPDALALRFNGSAAGDGQFAHGARGSLRLTLQEALLDGKPVELRVTQPQQPERYIRGALTLAPQMEITPVGADHRLLQGKQLTARVEIQPVIDARNINSEIHSRSQFNVQLVQP